VDDGWLGEGMAGSSSQPLEPTFEADDSEGSRARRSATRSMSETLVLGAINGLTIGLLAVGLVLVYKANRFINLAHAQLGTLSAVLLAKLAIDWGVSWWLAFPAAVALGIGTGLAVEKWVIRPLRARS